MIASSCCYSGNRFNQCWKLFKKKNLLNQCAKGRSITISERNRADSLLATYGIAPITMGHAGDHDQKLSNDQNRPSILRTRNKETTSEVDGPII